MPFQMGVKPAANAFDGLAEVIRRLARPGSQHLDRIENSVRRGFAGNFTRESVGGGGPWAALRPRTQRERVRGGYGATNPILRRSGGYMRSWTEAGGWRSVIYTTGGWTMHVSSEHPYAFVHELGNRGRNIPARPVRYLDTGDIRVVASVIENWVDRVIASVSP